MPIVGGYDAVVVEKGCESKIELVVEEILHSFGRFVLIKRQDCKAFRAVLLKRFLHLRHFNATQAAPRRPEIDHDRFAAKV